MASVPSHLDHLRVLERWPRFAEQYWWDDPQRPDIGCFGTGYNTWGVQTNQKFLGAYAVLAADPDLNEAAAGRSREALLDKALRALRYSLASHISGGHHCSDGTPWGHTWISALGVERMMHGVEAIWDHLTDADRDGLRRMLCSEADWLLTDLEVQGTPWARDGGNKPESNIWNGAILARAALTYPDEKHAADWMEKAHRFLINGISVATDAMDTREVAGRPISEWHVGPNFFPNYALDHHAYLNVGYMVICLSNIAMFHFGCVLNGYKPPESLYHHAADLWNLVKRLVFADGRLVRIGGDSRQRYCYCQDYLLPSLLFCVDYLGDAHAAELEAGALGLIRQEQQSNDNDSFLSPRLSSVRDCSPYYYTRLEADKAVVLSMNAYWRRVRALTAPEPAQTREESVRGNWEEQEHGAMLHRSPRRIASWSWRAHEAPQGLCLPPDSGHLAEWCESMGGRVRLLGEQGARAVLEHRQVSFPGGFLTTGTMADSTKQIVPEGWKGTDPARHRYAVAALPDDRTMLVLEHCRLQWRTYLNEVKGLKLNIPNDLFNEYTRTYQTAAGEVVARGDAQGLVDLQSRWVNVADAIGVVGLYGAETLSLYQAGKRRASGFADSLYYDEICAPCRVGMWDVPPDTTVLDCGSAVLSGATRAETEALAREGVQTLACSDSLARAVQVRGADGALYLLAANFGVERATFTVTLTGKAAAARNVATGEALPLAGGALSLALDAGGAALVRLEG